MGLRKLHKLVEQDGGSMDAQVAQLNAQIDQARTELKQLKSSPGGEVASLEKQLSAIYKQIEDTKKARMDKEEIAYFQGLVDKAQKTMDAIFDKAREDGIMEQVAVSTDPNQSLKDQVQQMKSQIVMLRKQEKQAKEQLQGQKMVKKKQDELASINKEKEEYQTYSAEQQEKITSSLNRRIDNANKALSALQAQGDNTEEMTEQAGAVPQLTPEQQKEKERLEKLIKSLTNEMNGINKRMAQISKEASSIMSENIEEERYQVNYNLDEKFVSKKQSDYFFAKCDEEGKNSKWCKMAKEFADDTDYDKLPKKKKRVKELQVWGVNSNPGFGLGDVPRDKMYSDVPRPAHMNVMGISEMKKPKMKKGKLLEYLSELTTRGGTNGKVYKKKDLTKQSGPYTEKAKSLEEVRKIISKLAEEKQNLQEVPVDYEDRPERINPDIERKLATQDTAFGKDFPGFPKVGDDEVVDNYEELIASDRFKTVVDNFKRYTGVEGNATDMRNLMQLQGMMMQSLQNTLRIEASNKQRLEDLAVEIVTKDLNVPEGSLQFDAEITGMKKLSKDDMRKKPQNQEQNLEQEEETLEHMEELDLEVAKRRFINAMMQGSAKKSLYLYHMVSDELNEIDPTLMNLYGVVISANDLMYWILPDMMGAGGGEGAPVFGKEKIDLSTTPPTIVAKGMTFPVLVHELHKGVMEYLSLHGLPGDKELRQKVMDKADFLEDEMWDLRLGPGLWERFIDAIGADDFDVKNYLYTEIIQMPAKEFLSFMKEVQSGSEKGKQMMVSLAKKIKDEIQQDEYEEATGEYDEDEGTSLMEPEEDIDISDLYPSNTDSMGQVMDIDDLLDKISEKGMDSLTPDELQFLKDQSK